MSVPMSAHLKKLELPVSDGSPEGHSLSKPQLEDGSVYRIRWWAYFDGKQNHLRA